MIISFNIGSERPINTYPFIFDVDNFKDFAEIIRRDMFTLILWSHKCYIPKSKMNIFLLIKDFENDYEKEITISIKNIRESLPYMKLSTDEIKEIEIANNRNIKLNTIDI